MKRWMTVAAMAGVLTGLQTVSAQQPATPTDPPKAPTSWADKVVFSGDVRFRLESIDEDGKPDRNRERFRARIGATAKPSTELDAVIRFSTDEDGDPTSGNQSFDNAGSKKAAYFDLGYLDYHPEAVEGLHLIGGKMELPFVKVSDLIFDNDWTPEGAAIKYKLSQEDNPLSAEFNGAELWLKENAAATDIMLYGGQAVLKYTEQDTSYYQVGAGYFQYDGVAGSPLLFNTATGNKGNSTRNVITGTTTSKVYATDYTVPEVFGEAWFAGDIPFGVYGSYSVNTEADANDTAYIVGLKVGKTKNPGDWDFDYNWRHIEKDSTLGIVSDSDSFGGGTDGEGHRVSVGYQVAKNLKANATYFIDQKAISKDAEVDYNRLQLDLAAKF